jgi:hypothetical protein
MAPSSPSKPRKPSEEASMHDDWKALFEEDELEKVFTYYKATEDNVIKEEEFESDKSLDSCETSESDLSDMDDLSEDDLKQNVYEQPTPIKKPKLPVKSPLRKKKTLIGSPIKTKKDSISLS